VAHGENIVSEMNDWQAEQFRDECERMRAIVESLERAEKAGTPRETVIHLADECGVGEHYRKHHNPT
jgi:hypothetical protein